MVYREYSITCSRFSQIISDTDNYYMALRDIMDSSESTSASGPSALAGLPSFWDHHETPPNIEWENWWDIFIVAVNAKHSISVH